jgi:hypothetical protein
VNRRFIHEPEPPLTTTNPIIEIAPVSPFGYRLRVDGREIGPKIGGIATAQYLRDWLEGAWEDIHRG